DPDTGLLAINHENITRDSLFPAGRDETFFSRRPTKPEQVRREMAAHGVSIVKLVRDGDGRWSQQLSRFNRRITAMTDIAMSGPAAGSGLLITPYSPRGNKTRATLGNSGIGYTPWRT